MQKTSFQIDLITEPEGGYTVIVPGLPGCVSFGNTIEEAKKNAKQAIDLHLENLKSHSKIDFKKVNKQSILSTVIETDFSYA